jgi:E3 ubiquitin-protein ligase synoviolin
MRSFGKRVVDFIRYRNATRDMNRRYADATAEEIAREDVCIICREEMRPWQPPAAAPADGAPGPRPTGMAPERLRPKKLPCGHILHFACLRSWLERQQNCPTCRRPVTTNGAVRMYPGGVEIRDGGNAAAAPQQQILGPRQAAGPNAQPGEPRPRAWILNFGPIRIGFGAGRGDLFQNLAQQIHNDHPQAPQGPNPNPAPGGPQQVGFGFGFGRHPVQQNQQNTQFNHHSVHAQLQQLEQQITQGSWCGHCRRSL